MTHAKRGKVYIIAIIAMVVGSRLLPMVLFESEGNGGLYTTGVVVVICVLMYWGHKWARAVLALMLLAAAALSCIGAVDLLPDYPSLATLYFGFAALYVVSVAVLFLSPAVGAYLESASAKETSGSQPARH
jgi:hypothetical protein